MGRFAPGNKQGKGRPKGTKNKKTVALEALLTEELGTDGTRKSPMQQIVHALVLRAKRGDIRAAEILLAYAYGKPRAIHEVTATHGVFDPVAIAKMPIAERLKILAELKQKFNGSTGHN